MEDVYKEIDSMDDTEQGIVIKTYNSDSDYDLRSKVRNINYNKIRFLRGNTNNKQYLYFELRKKSEKLLNIWNISQKIKNFLTIADLNYIISPIICLIITRILR